MKNIGLIEFAEKYLRIKNQDGTTRTATLEELNTLKMIEKAKSEGKELRMIKGRNGNKIVLV